MKLRLVQVHVGKTVTYLNLNHIVSVFGFGTGTRVALTSGNHVDVKEPLEWFHELAEGYWFYDPE